MVMELRPNMGAGSKKSLKQIAYVFWALLMPETEIFGSG